MRPDKPQFWTGGGGNIAMTEMTKPGIWEPIKNLTTRTLVDVHIDSREMLQGAFKIIQDGIVTDVITTPVQKNIFIIPSQSLSFKTMKIGTYDISTATFTREVLNVATQNTISEAMMYNNDGTKLYVLLLGVTNMGFAEHTLSTPYDISTSTSTRWALDVTAQDTSPQAMMYNNDGTRLYVLGDQNNNIYEYGITTPYDISTGSFSRIAFNVAAQDTSPQAMMYNNDGTRLYVLGNVGDNIYEYGITTPYDISTATYTRIALDVTAQDTSPQVMMYNNDGTRLYVLGNVGDNIYEYIINDIWTGNVKIRTINN